MDAIAKFKEAARAGWETFAPTEMATGSVAPRLVEFAGIERGMRVLDVGCGTGVVALTAARAGAWVTGSDLTPKLLERARENSAIMGLDVDWREADAEALPYADAEFDVVVSQFGHMFAPRPEIAVREMLRVLKPGGTVAFSTWPPELLVGRMFALIGRYAPPPPPGASPPHQWGDPDVVRERLGNAVTDLFFDRDVMYFQILSIQHQRLFLETNVGPVAKLVEALGRSDPARLATFRAELEQLIGQFFADNHLKQDYLLTRARKR
ncbi:MAG TPA: class I SAM-dependent methyltransferase [Gammaproteobacteria bacterium]|jgi:SAM-dependent methyltransferase|nr:class I SAM-dependent methyltransferase [Gammaproteobacteria bacterium]